MTSPEFIYLLLAMIIGPFVIFICYKVYYSLIAFHSGLKVILFGLHISFIGAVIALDSTIDFARLEYLIILFGLFISFIGLKNKR